MDASTIIITKLIKSPNEKAEIKQLNGKITNLYFVNKYETFWSDHLSKVVDEGYDFEMFNWLQKESYRFEGRRIPKGNARKYKLGEVNCDMDTAVGILGYKYYKAKTGDSIFDPIHVIAAVLEWAGIAYNKRGYIEFIL